MSQVMSYAQDDDYPSDLDLTTSSQENQEDIQAHVVGGPPESITDCSDENGLDDSFLTSGTGSGSEPFPIDDYEYTVNQSMVPQEPLEEMEDDLVANAPDDIATFGLTEFMGDPLDIIRVFFTSTLVSHPLKLQGGYDPEELEKCISDGMQFNLFDIGWVLLGDKMNEIPKNSKIEVAHALTKQGWLECKSNRFYPVLPENELETIASLIEGSEKLIERESQRKKTSDIFPNVEIEVSALYTFNMIVELLHAIRQTYSIHKVPYHRISHAFVEMVEGKEHENIMKKYAAHLKLDSSMRWNTDWFKKFVNRSTLKKFLQMAKFSEIVVTDDSHFYFRADDDNNRPVVMFTNEDIKEVKDKWASGNAGNRNYGNNFVRGGQRAERNVSSFQQKPKQVEQDPNYRSSTFAGGFSSQYDDGSLLEPAASSRREDNQPSTSTRGIRRSPSPLPVRPNEKEKVAETLFAQDQSSGSRASSPEPARQQNLNPFAGKPVQNKIESERQRVANSGHGGGYQAPRPMGRVTDYGETSSEGEITSEGSYSDEDEDVKEEKRKRRVEIKNKKTEREMRRRERHKQEKPTNTVTRFQTNPFYKPALRTPEPEKQTPVDPSASDRESTSAAAETVEQAPAPIVQKPTVRSRDDDDIPPPLAEPSQRRLPLAMSSSQHNEERITAQVPYRPAEGVMERNKAVEEEKKKREELSNCRLATLTGKPPATAQHPYLAQSSSSRAAPSQDPPKNYSEPFTTNGFANRNHAQPDQTIPPRAPPARMNTGRPMDEEYKGRNHQGPREPQPPQPMQQPFQQQPPRFPPVQQQYPPPQQIQQQQQYPPQQQYNYPQQQPQQFQPPMPQQNVHSSCQDHYRREPSRASDHMQMNDPSMGNHSMNVQQPMSGTMNQYQQPSYQMNPPPQPYQPLHYGNSNQSNGDRYMQNAPRPMYNPPSVDPLRSYDVYGVSNRQNFNRITSNTPASSSTTMTFSTTRRPNDDRERHQHHDENSQIKSAIMFIAFKYQTERRPLLKEDLEREAQNPEVSRIFPQYFNFVAFIQNEMRNQLLVEQYPDSRIGFRILT